MNFIELFKAFFIGIVEGITEWLPISSTGHMLIVDEFINLNVSQDFKNMFFVVIQLGAILAVALLYFKKLNPFSPSKSKEEKRNTWSLWFKVAVACLPIVIVGMPLDNILEEYLQAPIIIALALIVYGILFIIIERKNSNKVFKMNSLTELTYKTAFLIGVFQILATIPGTSRSGATIIGAMLFGCSRFVAAEFTFFLGIPVMFGASLLKLIKFGFSFTALEIGILLVAMITSFIVSVIAIKFLMGYIKKHDFKAFGWYRIVLGSILIILILIGLL